MKIAIGCDHGGFELKAPIVALLQSQNHEVIDLGTDSEKSVDYPDYALSVGLAVIEGLAERGILLCGSGVGASVAVNKIPGIRAGLCHDTFSAHQGKEDDDTNVLCLGARVIGVQLALDIVRTWLKANFSGAERHMRRLAKVAKIEHDFLQQARVSK